MKQMRWKPFLTVLLALSTVGYLAADLYVQASRTAKMATTVSRLGEIRMRLVQYQQDHGTLPREGLAGLGLRSHDIQDPITGEPFSYRPNPERPDSKPIVEQVSAFRTRLWPLGEMRRYVLYANGDIFDAQADDSAMPRTPGNDSE